MSDSEREFAEAVRPVCAAIGEFTRHANRLTGLGRPNVPGAIATTEGACEPDFAETMWPEPVRTAHYHAAVLMYFLVDHVDAMAALLPNASIGPAYAHLALLRPVVDVAVAAAWINDPKITTDVRIRRGIALERRSLDEQVRLPIPPVVQAAEARRRRLNDYERKRKWTKRETVP